MELLKKVSIKKVKNWGVSFIIFCLFITSCSVFKATNRLENKMSGGYESISYNSKDDIDNKANIFGNVVEGKTKVENAEVIFYNYKEEIVFKTLTDKNGDFQALIDKNLHFGSVEIDGNERGLIIISPVDFGSLYHNTKIKARLHKFNYAISETDFPNTKDLQNLKKEIKDSKEK